MDKKRCHYDLKAIKEKIVDPASRILTTTARDTAITLGFTDDDIVSCIIQMTNGDFYKSMTTVANHAIWQDVYKPTYKNHHLYVKVQLNESQSAVVISFKQDEEALS